MRRSATALGLTLVACSIAAAAVTTGIPDADDTVRMTPDGRYLFFNRYSSPTFPTGGLVHLDRATGIRTIVVNVVAGSDQGMSLAANGRVMAFAFGSQYATLLPPDANGALWDVYVRDLDTGVLSRVSVASDGTQGNGHSAFPVLSADGRFVAFASAASNLVPDDTNGALDVFVHDRFLGTTERVNVRSDGAQSIGDYSTIAAGPPLYFNHSPSISADGRYVAFWSLAPDLVTDDTNQNFDAFVHDRQTGETTRVSVKSDGSQSNPYVGPVHLGISGDGRFVAFESRTNDLDPRKTTPSNVQGMFVHDRQTGITELVSLNSAGESANGLSSGDPHLSFDGRFVTFESNADNLVADDTNAYQDVFLRDRLLGKTERVNVGSMGEQGHGYLGPGAGPFQTSDDGRFVVFTSPVDLDPSGGPASVYVRDRTCANGVLEGTELCDDGNLIAGDGCELDCRPTACTQSFCGDGQVSGCETCDSGRAIGTCCAANCTEAAVGTPCDDGDPCTQGETCTAGAVCVTGQPTQCDPCLVCDAGSGACVPPGPGACAPAAPGRSVLKLATSANPARTTLAWSWKGAAVAIDDFGLPLQTSEFQLCVYDQGGITLSAMAPASGTCDGRACWNEIAGGFRYRDRDATPDGLLQVLLASGEAGRAKLKLRGRGPNLRLAPLGLSTPVTVRVSRRDASSCWEAEYSAPARNDATRFKAKSD